MLKNIRGLAAIGFVVVASFGLAPIANGADMQPSLVWSLSSPERTMVDLPPTGPSIGDITVTNGDIAKTSGRKAIGFYTTNQTTVRVNIPGGREIREVDLSLSVPGGVIYATALIRANSGTPPTQSQTFAIVGGTGKYSGVAGQLIHDGFTEQGSTIKLYLAK